MLSARLVGGLPDSRYTGVLLKIEVPLHRKAVSNESENRLLTHECPRAMGSVPDIPQLCPKAGEHHTS